MYLISKLYDQTGGYIKGQEGKTDDKGNRIFMVLLLKGEDKNPLYKDDNSNEFKIFKGKSPKEVAKKVVTEVCRLLKLEDPEYYRRVCRAITEEELEERNKEIIGLGTNIQNIDLKKFPGFHFELIDTMNKTSDGKERSYRYYGERIKLNNAKIYKGKKFNYEAQVLPLRKDYNLNQASYDHIIKSKEAKSRYNKTNNFEKRHSRSRTKSKNRSKSNNKHNIRIEQSGKGTNDNKHYNKMLNMTDNQIKLYCKKLRISDINQILEYHNLSLSGTKITKCQRLIDFKNISR